MRKEKSKEEVRDDTSEIERDETCLFAALCHIWRRIVGVPQNATRMLCAGRTLIGLPCDVGRADRGGDHNISCAYHHARRTFWGPLFFVGDDVCGCCNLQLVSCFIYVVI